MDALYQLSYVGVDFATLFRASSRSWRGSPRVWRSRGSLPEGRPGLPGRIRVAYEYTRLQEIIKILGVVQFGLEGDAELLLGLAGLSRRKIDPAEVGPVGGGVGRKLDGAQVARLGFLEVAARSLDLPEAPERPVVVAGEAQEEFQRLGGLIVQLLVDVELGEAPVRVDVLGVALEELDVHPLRVLVALVLEGLLRLLESGGRVHGRRGTRGGFLAAVHPGLHLLERVVGAFVHA